MFRIPAPRTACATVAIGACGLVLTACGGLGVQADWDTKPNLPALESILVEVAEADLHRICGDHPGMALYGCARRDFEMRACFIYTAPKPDAWLLEHERKHCAGYDHGIPGTTVAAAAPHHLLDR